MSLEINAQRIDRLASLSELSEKDRKNFGEHERPLGRIKRATYVIGRQYTTRIDLTFASTAIQSVSSDIWNFA